MHRARTVAGRLGPLVARSGYSSSNLATARSLTKPVTPTINAIAANQKVFVRSYATEASFLNGTSSSYIEELYETWTQDPSSVHKSWDAYFRTGQYVAPPSLNDDGALPSIVVSAPDVSAIDDHLAVQALIRSYQIRGHFQADLDPLGLDRAGFLDGESRSDLLSTYKYHTSNPATFQLSEKDLDRKFKLPPTTHIGGNEASLPLREIIRRLEEVYCKHIGIEYKYITNRTQCDWIRGKFEVPEMIQLPNEENRHTLSRLLRATKFEEFLAAKFPGDKRFGLEGCEVLIPAMKTIIDISNQHGVENFIIAMPHRGRLNVLANVCRMDLAQIFNEFRTMPSEDVEGSGDVKYHLGMSQTRLNRVTNKEVKISLCANPSHLEAVDPICLGKVKGEQFYSGDTHGDKTLAIMLHGDAAFSGQGVVYETFHLSDLPDFCVHGCIHIVVNNQIGFTTDPRSSRSSPYCTDVARVVNAPIFHVNGDKPEPVIQVSKAAAEWRQEFKKDVVIDLVCYRKNGHNETDVPDFTQPRMYKQIAAQRTVLDQYVEDLTNRGVITHDEYQAESEKYNHVLKDNFEKSKDTSSMVSKMQWLDSPWPDFFKKENEMKFNPTGVNGDILSHIGHTISTPPENFTIHPKLKPMMRDRGKLLAANTVDWAMAEAMAVGSLLMDNVHVRISGQDVQRGTFSQRHHVLHDQENEKTFTPLNHLSDTQMQYSIINSSLSEFGVLGFEVGFSQHNPHALVCWEAQFGDFSNTAQPIIDQFISSGQAKWTRQSGIVMLLPHGYDGMGPEHSSARMERFLQLCNDKMDHFPIQDSNFETQQLHDCNMMVIYCTTPSNYFHALRRQVVMPIRRPLIIMTSKSLLRSKDCRSSLADMTEGTTFQRFIPETGVATEHANKVQRLILCSGQIYYQLKNKRDQNQHSEKVAIARVEQISPFPFDAVKEELEKYPHADVMWAQEEHQNMGAYTYVKPRIETVFKKIGAHKELIYAGRASAAATATGRKSQHNMELQQIMKEAFLGIDDLSSQ